MGNLSEKAPAHEAGTHPLEHVSVHFKEDMLAVNTLILDHIDSDIPLVKQIATYLIAAGGKRIRPLLTLCFSDICGQVSKNTHQLAAAVEFIHTATLLHDDVVDESDQRRGKDSANNVFDNKAPVLVGDYLFSRAFLAMVATNNMEALATLAKASAVIAEGEVLQLAVKGQLDVDRQTHLKVLEGKTAALFAAACESGAIVAGASGEQRQAAHNFGLNLGLCFQIIDDLIDYSGDENKLGKNIGDDFMEGKITLPVFIAHEHGSDTEKAFWVKVLDKDYNRNEDDLAQAITYMKSHQAFDQTLAVAQEFHDKALEQLNSFKASDIKDMLISILNFTISRKY